MPGRLFLTMTLGEVAAHFGADATGLDPDPPRHNIAPGQPVLVCTAGRRLERMRWGMIPVGRLNARGRPVMETIVNARSETVFAKTAFAGTARALVPANGWYEWTGERRRKTAWRIAALDGGLLAFAAIADLWRGPGGVEVAQVATLTCPPSADVARVHDRMGLLLDPEQFETWLTGDAAAASALARPFPDGRLLVTEASGIDWSAP